MAKFGYNLEQALWELPLAALNQLLIWDDLVNGQKPRWHTDGIREAADIDALLADALTSAR